MAYKEKNPNIKVTEITRDLSNQYKELSDKQKKKYEEEYQKDVKRYE